MNREQIKKYTKDQIHTLGSYAKELGISKEWLRLKIKNKELPNVVRLNRGNSVILLVSKEA